MLIRRPKSWELKENQTTPEKLYMNRRQIIAGLGLASGAVTSCAQATTKPDIPGRKLDFSSSKYKIDEPSTPYDLVTSYNNFYEFGTDKSDPAKYAHTLITDPWSIEVEGHAAKTGTFALEDIIRPEEQEERIYRLRCVEAWSMVIPWVGVPLHKVLARFEPTSKAKYVQFVTKFEPNKCAALVGQHWIGPIWRGCAWTKR